MLKRFLLSLLVAALTLWMSLETVYTENRTEFTRRLNTSVGFTRIIRLPEAAKKIENFRQQNGHLPENLPEVETVPDFDKSELAYWRTDTWEHPLAYQRQGERFSLVSYGHDGKPGGIGLDADIVYGEKKVSNTLTFWQFLTYSDAIFLRPACVFAAIFAFFVAMSASGKEAKKSKKAGSVAILLRIAAMVGISVLGAVFIASLDYPSGM